MDGGYFHAGVRPKFVSGTPPPLQLQGPSGMRRGAGNWWPKGEVANWPPPRVVRLPRAKETSGDDGAPPRDVSPMTATRLRPTALNPLKTRAKVAERAHRGLTGGTPIGRYIEGDHRWGGDDWSCAPGKVREKTDPRRDRLPRGRRSRRVVSKLARTKYHSEGKEEGRG